MRSTFNIGRECVMKVKKVSNNAVQQIIDAFNESLMDGSLQPGDQIPTEIELSERFGVARNTVREAIKILTAMGVLEIRRPVGTFVCEGFSETMMTPLLYGIILGRGENYGELMDLREIMETGSMLTVIRNAGDAEILSLSEPLAALREACYKAKPSYREVFEKDDAFHDAINALTHNRMVERIASTVRTMTHDMRSESVRLMVEHGKSRELYQVHEKIFEILRTRDVDGVYREIRSTYFVPDGDGGVISLSDQK